MVVARISTGTASAVAAQRAILRYGRERVLLHFSDVFWEDGDNYRFMADLMRFFGGRLYGNTRVSSGGERAPRDVWEERSLIPNSAHAPCSYELKMKPFEEWLWRLPKPVVVVGGLGWQEPHRIDRLLHYHKHAGQWRKPQGFAARISGVYEEFPLLWKPIETRPYSEVVRSWGIEPPRAYRLGFPHANCHGACCRQGIEEWHRLYFVDYTSFAESRDWEQAQRAKGGARANAAFCQSRVGGVSVPVTLAELEQKWRAEQCAAPSMFENTDDNGSCFCTDWIGEAAL